MVFGARRLALSAIVSSALVLAACSSTPRVADAVNTCNTTNSPYVVLSADGDAVTIDGSPRSGQDGAPMATVQCVLKLLTVSDEVMAGIEAATTPDGDHEGEWDGLHAAWTFRPTTGLHLQIQDRG